MARDLSARDYCILNAEEADAISALNTLEEAVQTWLDDNSGWQLCGGVSLIYQDITDTYIAAQAVMTLSVR
ncbi:hypothetical protein [Thiolapillus sp.]